MQDKQILAVRDASDISKWFTTVPELRIIADIDPVFVYGEDASEMTPALWLKLSSEIQKRYTKYDGFVITHGVDTIIYTASALSFILQGLSKPIVLTGSPLPSDPKAKASLEGLIEDYRGLGVKANLINAIQVATMDIAEVAIMFGNRLIRGNQALKGDTPTFNIFDSLNRQYLGKVDFGIRLFENRRKRSKQKLQYYPHLDTNVYTIQLYPGIAADILGQMLEKKCHGIIVRTYHTNLFPDSFAPVLRKAKQKAVPVIAHNPFSLDSKKKKVEYIAINEMTFEAALTKLMWILGKTKNLEDIRKRMKEDMAGEISMRP